MKELIELLEPQLRIKMHQHCIAYLKSDEGFECCPRWYNYESDEGNELIIQSTQHEDLGFIVFIPKDWDEDINVLEFWEEFKVWRNEFLKVNYNIIAV